MLTTILDSQGGVSAWGVSELLAANTNNTLSDLEGDYLGSVIFAPGINSIYVGPPVFCVWIGKDLDLIYPDFKLSDWLSPLGIARTELLTQIQGGQYVSEIMLLANATEILSPQWNSSWYAETYTKYANPGNRPYKPPMLLFKGTEDQGYDVTVETFQSTCANHHSGSFEMITLPGVGHFPSMDSSRQQWLQWIEDRFNAKPIASQQCTNSTLESFLPSGNYQNFSTSFLQWAGAPNEYFDLVAGGF
jgi:hypothetical protein